MLDLAMGTASNELLYGKGGYLYALLFVHKHVKPDDTELTDIATKVAMQIIKEGREHKCGALLDIAFLTLNISPQVQVHLPPHV